MIYLIVRCEQTRRARTAKYTRAHSGQCKMKHYSKLWHKVQYNVNSKTHIHGKTLSYFYLFTGDSTSCKQNGELVGTKSNVNVSAPAVLKCGGPVLVALFKGKNYIYTSQCLILYFWKWNRRLSVNLLQLT